MAKKKLILFSVIVVATLSFFIYQKVGAANVPALKEGTYLTGQTLSTWPSWSTLGNFLGVSLPSDPINQLATAGTCVTSTNRFCINDSQCPAGETCVLHDPETGWSVANRRFTFACSRDSYAYRYIASTTPGVYTVRARFEDTGISPININSFVASFVSTSIFKINDSSGVCNFDQEISSMQSGVCGDGKLNLNKGEQCDPPGRIEYAAGCAGSIRNLTVCGKNCQWTASTTLCSGLSKCGNGSREFGETCDDGNLNGKYNHCNITCNGVSALGKCGDAVLQSAYEVCDPGVAGKEKYAAGKAASCSWDCQNFGPYCGDAITQTQYGEECDGSQACSIDGNQGIKVCTSGCKMSPSATSSASWVCTVSSTVATVSAPGTCGDAVVGTDEACDRGLANNGLACAPTYGAPCSYCSADCQNTIDVQPSQYCGNGIIESSEKCEVSGGNIFSAATTTGRTFSAKNLSYNGYQELACAEETPATPHTIKKGTKSCPDCAAGVVRNCVKCGIDVNGVRVEGSIRNVLENPITNSSLDPLFVKKFTYGALSLAVSLCRSSTGVELCPPWLPSVSPLVARALKNINSDLVFYALHDPHVNGYPPALINSDPICSAGDSFNDKYQMYVNHNWSRPLNFPVVAEPQPWQYDLLLSPVVSSTKRAKDLRVVVSWVGSGDFYSGVLNPFNTTTPQSSQIDGASYITQGPSYQYATGTTYYNSPADFKKSGVWYHGFNSTPGQTSAEAFTIDTAAMSGNTYSFYVRAPSYPIRTFKNTARLKVDVYLPEQDNDSYHFGTPARTYQLQFASPSDNQNARYWQVFNINAPSSSLSISDIIGINAIVTGPAYFKYTNPLVANPTCTNADWQSSEPLLSLTCTAPTTYIRTWTKTTNCVNGVTHPATEIVTCKDILPPINNGTGGSSGPIFKSPPPTTIFAP